MKVDISQEEEFLVFKFAIEEGDRGNPNQRFTIGETDVKVEIGNCDPSNIHPDLIALCSILMCHPFVGKRLDFPLDVSNKFRQQIKKVVSRYEFITPSKKKVEPRKAPSGYRMGLAYSGGVDSTAALSLLPPDTIPVFMLRPEKGKSLYNPEAALESCKSLSEIGYDVRVVKCDVEYMRNPVGFPTDLSHAIPAILLADEMSIDSLSFGTVLESAFGIGHEEYRDYFSGSHKRFYGSILDAVGIELCLPVSGISEVGTSMIIEASPLGGFSQSCIRGKWGKPCNRCWKCCRKGLLGAAISSNRLNTEEIGLLLSSEEVRSKLSANPISHENVIEYSIQRIQENIHPKLDLLRKRVNRGTELGHLERWYGPSIDLVPQKYRRGVKERIMKFMNPMTEEEEECVVKWSMTEFIESKNTVQMGQMINDEWRQ